MVGQIGGLAIAYLCGSLPTGYLVGRAAGIDIREKGSGSTGATNVWRNLGWQAGLFVFAVDWLKGAIAVWLMMFWGRDGAAPEWWAIGAGALAVLGHSRSVWLGFGGGKSVATGLGVLLALSWPVALSAFGVWLLAMALWQTVSIASILAAIAAPCLMWGFGQPLPYLGLAIVAGGFVIVRHRSNIERIWAGTEPKMVWGNGSQQT
ncbi:MAG: glycerol-3-phosphate 1-O-acyltransferase PlsY [Pseudanabaenaceae cyanobacterium]